MNLRHGLAFLFIATQALSAQSLREFPDWALPAYRASRAIPKPDDADDWVLLDRTEFAYTGDGEIAIHRCRLVEVLTDRGTSAGVFRTIGLGGGASKVKKLKGWNFRPDGDTVKLDSVNVVAIEKPGDSSGVTNERVTSAVLQRVVKGSVVAFESVQTQVDPGGPATISWVMERSPIFRWEITAAAKGGWFTDLKQVSLSLNLRHFSPWIQTPTLVPNVSAAADNIPALPRDEGAISSGWNTLPRVSLKFMDPDLKGAPATASWDGIAAWEESVFADKAAPRPLPGQSVLEGKKGLDSIHQWVNSQLTYKQVYMSPERGLIPLSADQVVRRRYGDCKDLASCFIAAARADGFEAFPVLARIIEGRIEPDEPVNPACFNHVIVAVRLKDTLHLPSEVQTTGGRFLLIDPTGRLTSLGHLPIAHAKGRLMICAEGKGIWVDVPNVALEHPEVEVALAASVDRNGGLRGTLRVKESADARGLRSGALGLDPQEYQRSIFSNFLYLPSNAHIQVLRHSDPLDVSKPFEVEVSIEDPTAFEIHGTEWDLDGMGIFRMVPPLIQRPGQPRQYPVESTGEEAMDVQAEITVPGKLTPVVAHRTVGTAFRDFQWDAKTRATEDGETLLSLRLKNKQKPVYFGFETRNAGLAEWALDRRQMRNIAADALAFEFKP